MTAQLAAGHPQALRIIEGCLADAERGGSRSVVVAGEAGSGKTHLLHAAARAAQARGFVVRWEHGPRSRRPSGRPTLVLCDDGCASPADHDGSGLVTLRTARAHLDGSGQDHVVTLEPLGDGDIAELASEHGVVLAPRVREAMGELSGRNPELVHALLDLIATADDAEALVRHPGRALRATHLREVVRLRLEGLGEATLQALSAGAVGGSTFRVQDVAALLRVATPDVTAALVPAAERALLRQVRPGMWTFRHLLVRELLCRDLTPPRRAALHTQLADLVTARGGDPEEVAAEVADHLLAAAEEGGDPAEALVLLRAATSSASPERARAAEWYERAADVAASIRAPAALRAELALALHLALGHAADPPGALQAWRQAATLARAAGDAELLARVASAPSLEMATFGIPAATRLEVLEDAHARIGAAATGVAVLIRARLAAELRWSPQRRRALELSRSATAAARRSQDPQLEAEALLIEHTGAHGPDMLDERSVLSLRALLLAHRAGDSDVLADACHARLQDLLELGQLEQAELLVDRTLPTVGPQGSANRRWFSSVYRYGQALNAGRFTNAAAYEREAALASWRSRPAALGLFLVRELCDARDPEPGRAQRLAAVADRTPQLPVWHALAARAALAEGRVTEAEALVTDRLGALLGSSRPGLHWLPEVALLGEVAVALQDRTRAAHLYRLLRPYARRFLVARPIPACAGSIALPLGLLAALVGDATAAAAHIDHAVTAHQPPALRVPLARTLCAGGAALSVTSDATVRAHGAALARDGAELARELGLPGLEDVATGATQAARVPRRLGTLRPEGDYWVLADERSVARVPDGRGLRLLARLVASPHTDHSAFELVASPGRERPVAPTGADVMLDRAAMASYRAGLTALAEHESLARSVDDHDRAERLRDEMAQVRQALSAATGLRGRQRLLGSESERARTTATKALRSALGTIRQAHPAIGDHLEASLRTGSVCCYAPAGDVLAVEGWS